MRAICAILVLVVVLISPSAAQEPCVSLACQLQQSDLERRQLERSLCELEDNNVERYTCIMRGMRISGACSTKPTSQEQIRCLEGTLDGMMRLIPLIIADQVQRELAPKIHK